MSHIYASKKQAVPNLKGKAAENISKNDMLHLSGAGAPQPMSPALREKFEPGFGADFSNIRISRGHIPEEMGVQAVAKGTDILIDSRAGMDVLGHELAHVVQQAQGQVQGGFPVVHNAALEHQADVMGARAASGLSAMEGGLSGFGGGEMMSIAPMSDASAPAQCKSRAEKKMDKAEKRRDKAIAAGRGDSEATRKARDAYGAEMRGIVRDMSEKDLHNSEVQNRLVNIAGSAANSGMKELGDKGWGDYATVLRGGKIESEQAGMNEMMIRLLGGRDQIRSSLKADGSDEDVLSGFTSQMEGNQEVMSMLGNFSSKAFEGVDAAAINSAETQDMAVMNNLVTRVISGAAAPTRAEMDSGKGADRRAIGRAMKMQNLAKANPTTGKLDSNSAAGKSFASLPSRARALLKKK